jgi:hypothetical protein
MERSKAAHRVSEGVGAGALNALTLAFSRGRVADGKEGRWAKVIAGSASAHNCAGRPAMGR